MDASSARVVGLAGLLLWSLPAATRAQPVASSDEAGPGTATPPTDPSPPAAAAQPPRLVRAEEAVYPPAALAAGLVAAVPCRVTLDAEGRVLDVEVLEPQGHGFDEAAVEAIRRSTFAPACRGAVPIPARFVYRYVFRLPEAGGQGPGPGETPGPSGPAAGPAGPGPGAATGPDELPPAEDFGEPIVTLEGDVLDLDDVSIEEAAISVAGGPLTEPVVAVADARGHFSVTDLPPGHYRLRVSAPGFATFESEEEVVPGAVTVVRYRLEQERSPVAFETVVRAQRPPREVTRRTIETREMALAPGSAGDALNAIQNMPGIARPIFGSGMVVIRGSNPGNTLYYLDGVSIPLVYHFGAFRSAINGDLLERIDYYPGNYSVRHSGALGGVIDVSPRVPNREEWTGYVDLNLVDGGALVEGPLAANASIAGSVRRSWIDATLPAILPLFVDEEDLSITAAPVYWDYQLLADWEPSDDDRLRFFLYGSDDSIAFLFGEPVQGDPTIQGAAAMNIGFHRLQTEWNRQLSPDAENRMLLAVGYNIIRFQMGDLFDVTYHMVPLQLREEFTFRWSEALQLTLGVDSGGEWYRARARLPDVFGMGSTGGPPLCGHEKLEVDSAGWNFWPGFFLETELRPVAGLRLIPGVRFDIDTEGDRSAIEPRLNVRYELVEGTTLKGGVGLYSQGSSPQETSDDTGNPDLVLQRSYQYGLGVEQELTDNINLSVDLFYKQLDHLVRQSDDEIVRDGARVAENFDNDSYGRVYGAELLARYEPDDWFFGWIAVTILRSERRDAGGPWKPSEFDQRLNLTLLGSVDLGEGWNIGLRFRVAQGYPYTPVVGSIYDCDCDQYLPVEGSSNSERLPWFHQLDLRVDKTFDWDVFKLSIYLDVQNVYFHYNVESIGYNHDYSRRTDVNGLPILPALGIKGSF
jgi:TonB family protein